MKLESVSIKRSDMLSEKWVQDQIAEDPSILELVKQASALARTHNNVNSGVFAAVYC